MWVHAFFSKNPFEDNKKCTLAICNDQTTTSCTFELCTYNKQSARSDNSNCWNLSSQSCFQSWPIICGVVKGSLPIHHKTIGAKRNNNKDEGVHTRNIVYKNVLLPSSQVLINNWKELSYIQIYFNNLQILLVMQSMF